MNTARGFRRWFYQRRSAWLVAAASAALVLLAAFSIDQFGWRADRAQLTAASRDLLTLLSQRMRGHEQILRGGAGLFDASDWVSRADWQAYVAQLRLAEKFPGVQGVGFALALTPAELPAHVAAVRAEGFPDYQIKPAGERPAYSPIVYLEPFTDRNLAAFGYDMLSEPTRRLALERATRSGNAAITGRVTLKQETHGDVQPGFLMFVPVYQRGANLQTEDERRAAIRGWVYSPFRVHDLIRGMLADSPRDLRFALFDGDNADDRSALMYLSEGSAGPGNWHHLPHYSLQQLTEYGQHWTLVTWLPAATSNRHTVLLFAVLLLGAVISVLLFLLVAALTKREQQAAVIAAAMTDNFRQSEAALAISAQRARAVIDHVADAILTLRSDGTILQTNPAAERLFSYPASKLIGANIQLLLPALNTEQLQALLPARNHGNGAAGNRDQHDSEVEPAITVPVRELEGRRADLSSVAIEMTLSVVRHAEPDVFIAVCRDVSERRRVDRLKREFVSTVSHELRTPLTSIAGALDLLISGQMVELPKPVQDLLTIAHRNSRRLAELINDLLDMEQISRGQMSFFMEPVAINSLLEQAVQSTESFASQHGITVLVEPIDSPVYALVDRKRLLQVLVNLLSNGIKFSPRGGSVRLRAERNGQWCRLLVIDQGPGVPKEFEARLFLQFSRADSADNRRIGGTGLGLVISKELTEKMRGRIGYQAGAEGGACFYVELPLAPAP